MFSFLQYCAIRGKQKWIFVTIGCIMILLLYYLNYKFTKKNVSKYEDLTSNQYEIISSPHTILDKWIKFEGEIYGYSAYWDSRIGNSGIFARVIVIAHRNISALLNLKCYVKYKNQTSDASMFIEIIGESHNKKHNSYMFICHPRTIRGIPQEITISSTKGENERVWMQIKRQLSKKSKRKGKMAVCVRPLFGPFNNTLALAEFIAFYKIIGFSHFIFYEQQITHYTKTYLMKLLQDGISIDLLPWNIPHVIKDTWSYGQLSSIQDCIYRYMYLYEYLLIVDVDEYTMPRMHYKMQYVMKAFTSKDINNSFGAFMIRQTYYCINNQSSQKPSLLINNIKRIDKIWPAKWRSKLIMKPETVEISGIHSVQKMFAKFKEVALPVEFVTLNHYRSGACENNRNLMKWKNVTYKNDSISIKYIQHILHSRPIHIWKEMFLKTV